MKRLLLSFVAIGILAAGHTQTVYDYAQDGKIWFKIKDDYIIQKRMMIQGQEDRRTEMQKMLDELPFLATLIGGFEVTDITAPFAHFKAPKLKITYQVDFADIHRVDEIIRELQLHPAVEYAEKIPLDRKTFTPNDPSYSPGQQWGLFRIQASQAWAQSLGNSNIVIAVVDDAVDIDHPDLLPILWVNTGEIPGNGIDDDGNGYVDDVNGVNVATTTPSLQGNPRPGTPLSSFDHGTHVAGIACAATNNGIGIASIGAGVRLMSIRSANTSGSLTSTLQGVLYAIDNGAHVINMSYGSSFFSQTYQNAITQGYNQGVVMVAAAGNDNVNTPFYPAGYDNVISVAASQGTDAKASFSNYDNGTGWVDLCAPGTSIYSTIPVGLGSYGNKQGTSMASPLVAGLCGLMLSMNPGLTPANVENCLKTTCDPATGTFAAQLGSGRINANNAMSCVASTLNWAPVADFTANITNITAGGTVSFTNLSIYNPTSYSWSFAGGTPATSIAVNPSVVYNTPGTYQVSLTATNANGSDTETKTAYITVNANTGCTEITNTLPGDTIYTYTFGGPNSYLGGTNTQGVIAYSEYYQATLFPAGSYIQNARIYFVRGQSTNPNDIVQIRIWNRVAGQPGTIVYTQNTLLSEIVDNQTVPGNPNAFYPTIVEFDVPFQITGDFYIGITVPQPTPTGQEYAIAYTHNFLNDATGRTNKAWLQMQAGNPLGVPAGWYAFDNFFTGNPRQSMHIYLRTTQYPVQANINANASPVCAGNSISYTNSTPANVTQNEWYVNGVTGGYSTLNNPSFIYNTPGTYKTYLVANNQCGYYAIDSMEVTVNPTPQLNVTPIDPVICPGGNVALSASGAASYTWSPPTGLSGTTGANVTASPTVNTTYTVVGTQGGCSSSSDVSVIVQQPPVADFLFTPGTGICFNQPIFFDGPVLSEDASGYSWAFTGGTPATSTNPTETVTFPGPGTYNVTLTVNNNCSQTDVETITVTIDNCDFLGLGEWNAQNIQGFVNPQTGDLMLNVLNVPVGKYELSLYSMLGALVQSEQLVVSSNSQQFQVPLNHSATGIYIVKISREEIVHSFRISK